MGRHRRKQPIIFLKNIRKNKFLQLRNSAARHLPSDSSHARALSAWRESSTASGHSRTSRVLREYTNHPSQLHTQCVPVRRRTSCSFRRTRPRCVSRIENTDWKMAENTLPARKLNRVRSFKDLKGTACARKSHVTAPPHSVCSCTQEGFVLTSAH